MSKVKVTPAQFNDVRSMDVIHVWESSAYAQGVKIARRLQNLLGCKSAAEVNRLLEKHPNFANH